jgi:hypothetical protein
MQDITNCVTVCMGPSLGGREEGGRTNAVSPTGPSPWRIEPLQPYRTRDNSHLDMPVSVCECE